MTSEIKQRIEQIRRGEVPEEYKKIHGDIVPLTWDQISLADCIVPYEEKTSVANQYPVLTSSRKGLMLQTDYYSNRQVTTEDNVGYNIIPFGYITFRSRSDDGRFKFNQNSIIDRGIISYFYPVFTFSDGVSCEFLLQLLNHTIYKKMFPFAEGTAQQVLSLKKLGRFKYPVPQIHEQQKIATVLSSQDKLVELKEKLLAEKQRQKKYLMQQLLTGKKRLSDFTVPWVATSLGNLFSERKETNCEKLQLLAITGTQGVIPRSELDLKDNSSEDKSKYLKIRIGDIGYNTMRMWQGVSAYSDYEGIVSPAYTILKPVADIDAKYFSYLFKLPETVFLFYRFSQGLVDDTRNLKYENFKKITVRYPSDRREQTAENNQKISALLAENENLLRCAGLNPPAANAALPPEKKIQFPSGYIRTVGHFKFRYHLSEIFPTKATRHNVTYALEVSDLMNYIVNRINIWGPVEVIFYKLAIVNIVSIMESILLEAANNICCRTQTCGKTHSCHLHFSNSDRNYVKNALDRLVELNLLHFNPQEVQHIKDVIDLRNRVHIRLTNGNELSNADFNRDIYNDAVNLLKTVDEQIYQYAVPLYGCGHTIPISREP